MSVSRIRSRYVVTLPKSVRKRRGVKVGDNLVWLPLSEKEFLAVVLPADRYQVLAELMGDVELSPEAKLAAQGLYFSKTRARREPAEMPVVETEFLLALRATDPKHKAALAIFRKFPDLEVCTAAFLEVAWLLRSQGKSSSEISLTLSLLRGELEDRGVVEVPLTSLQVTRAHDILTRHAMTFFDALILANAEESSDRRLISNDNSFDQTQTVQRLQLR